MLLTCTETSFYIAVSIKLIDLSTLLTPSTIINIIVTGLLSIYFIGYIVFSINAIIKLRSRIAV